MIAILKDVHVAEALLTETADKRTKDSLARIYYPQIFRLLSQNPNYLSWDKAFASKFGIDWDDVQEKIQKYGESELIDEEWEQVVQVVLIISMLL